MPLLDTNNLQKHFAIFRLSDSLVREEDYMRCLAGPGRESIAPVPRQAPMQATPSCGLRLTSETWRPLLRRGDDRVGTYQTIPGQTQPRRCCYAPT